MSLRGRLANFAYAVAVVICALILVHCKGDGGWGGGACTPDLDLSLNLRGTVEACRLTIEGRYGRTAMFEFPAVDEPDAGLSPDSCAAPVERCVSDNGFVGRCTRNPYCLNFRVDENLGDFMRYLHIDESDDYAFAYTLVCGSRVLFDNINDNMCIVEL